MTERRELRFDVPDYFNGELRVMAVGVGETRMGAAQRPVTVRGPLVLTPNLPLAVAPGDVFDVSVGVANHVQGAGTDAVVTLSAASAPGSAPGSEGLVVEGDARVSLPVAENGEGRATFRVRAGDAPGAAMLTLTATLGGETVRRSAGVSVRPAAVFATTVESGFDARAAQVDLPRRLYPAFAERRVLASASPLALADGLLEYLETFPHACAEQTVSKTFPLIGLARARSFPLDRDAFDARFRDALAKLRPRQDTSGGFRFWLDSEEAAPFPSVYVAHFLMDARDAGAPAPADMLDAALGYLRAVADATLEGTHTLEDARIRAYAIYVLTRGGRVTTNYLTALQQDLETPLRGRVAKRHRRRLDGRQPRPAAQRAPGGRARRGLPDRRRRPPRHGLRHPAGPRRPVRLPARAPLPRPPRRRAGRRAGAGGADLRQPLQHALGGVHDPGVG